MKNPLLITFIVFLTLSASAQNNKIKFGKVSEEELQLEECSFYPDANSMILSESGYLRFVYHNEKGWRYQLEVHKRIKVFNKLEKDVANISLIVYDPEKGYSREEIVSIKGFTFNLVDGKIVKDKLTNSEEYTTRISDYRKEVSFAMPNVQDGSVIDYEYTLVSDYITNLHEWHFQHELPTAVSNFQYVIPEFFFYTESQVGSYVQMERETNSLPENFQSVSSLSKKTEMTATNVAPLEDEPHMNNKSIIPARIEFQLMSINMPNSIVQQIAGSYEKFNETLMESSSFGGALSKGNFAKDKISELAELSNDERAQQIFNWLQGHFSFNDTYGMSSSSAGRTAFKNAVGSVADINLSLVAAFREAELEAYPVILCTRGHGIPHPAYPSFEDFNYVVAAVNTTNGIVLCDASTNMPFGMLPTRCLNSIGWLASEHGGQKIDLKQNAVHSTISMSQIDFNENQIETKIDIKMDGYAGLSARSAVKSDEDKFKESILSEMTEMQYEFTDYSKSEEDATEFKMSIEGTKDIDVENVIYIQPMIFTAVKENPFKRETRNAPIDFSYAYEKRNIVKISVPEGYQAELPESISVALPDNAGQFTYSARQLGNIISINCLYSLSKKDFTAVEYPQLKQFYQLVSDKNNEMIVLKKKT